MKSAEHKRMAESTAKLSPAEIKQYLLRQREGFAELERRQIDEAMAKSPSERLMETLELCDSAAEFTRYERSAETYLAETACWRRLAKAWKAKQAT